MLLTVSGKYGPYNEIPDHLEETFKEIKIVSHRNCYLKEFNVNVALP